MYFGFYKHWKMWSKNPSRSAWLWDHSIGKKGKQEGKAHFAISFPSVVRDDPSSAALHSGKMGVPKLHPRRSNRGHKTTSGTSPLQMPTERWQSLREELRDQSLSHVPHKQRVALMAIAARWEGITVVSRSSTAVHLSWLSLITIALATSLKYKFTQ